MRIVEDIGQGEDSITEHLRRMDFHMHMMRRMQMDRFGDEDDDDMDLDPHMMMFGGNRRPGRDQERIDLLGLNS